MSVRTYATDPVTVSSRTSFGGPGPLMAATTRAAVSRVTQRLPRSFNRTLKKSVVGRSNVGSRKSPSKRFVPMVLLLSFWL